MSRRDEKFYCQNSLPSSGKTCHVISAIQISTVLNMKTDFFIDLMKHENLRQCYLFTFMNKE